MDYSNKEVQIKAFTPESLDIVHEDATQSNSFALRLSNDKLNGVYVEVGSSHYKKHVIVSLGCLCCAMPLR